MNKHPWKIIFWKAALLKQFIEIFHVTLTDDVTWPLKIKVMTPNSFRFNISKTLRDRGLVQIDHLQQIILWNGILNKNTVVKVLTKDGLTQQIPRCTERTLVIVIKTIRFSSKLSQFLQFLVLIQSDFFFHGTSLCLHNFLCYLLFMCVLKIYLTIRLVADWADWKSQPVAVVHGAQRHVAQKQSIR